MEGAGPETKHEARVHNTMTEGKIGSLAGTEEAVDGWQNTAQGLEHDPDQRYDEDLATQADADELSRGEAESAPQSDFSDGGDDGDDDGEDEEADEDEMMSEFQGALDAFGMEYSVQDVIAAYMEQFGDAPPEDILFQLKQYCESAEAQLDADENTAPPSGFSDDSEEEGPSAGAGVPFPAAAESPISAAQASPSSYLASSLDLSAAGLPLGAALESPIVNSLQASSMHVRRRSGSRVSRRSSRGHSRSRSRSRSRSLSRSRRRSLDISARILSTDQQPELLNESSKLYASEAQLRSFQQVASVLYAENQELHYVVDEKVQQLNEYRVARSRANVQVKVLRSQLSEIESRAAENEERLQKEVKQRQAQEMEIKRLRRIVARKMRPARDEQQSMNHSDADSSTTTDDDLSPKAANGSLLVRKSSSSVNSDKIRAHVENSRAMSGLAAKAIELEQQVESLRLELQRSRQANESLGAALSESRNMSRILEENVQSLQTQLEEASLTATPTPRHKRRTSHLGSELGWSLQDSLSFEQTSNMRTMFDGSSIEHQLSASPFDMVGATPSPAPAPGPAPSSASRGVQMQNLSPELKKVFINWHRRKASRGSLDVSVAAVKKWKSFSDRSNASSRDTSTSSATPARASAASTKQSGGSSGDATATAHAVNASAVNNGAGCAPNSSVSNDIQGPREGDASGTTESNREHATSEHNQEHEQVLNLDQIEETNRPPTDGDAEASNDADAGKAPNVSDVATESDRDNEKNTAAESDYAAHRSAAAVNASEGAAASGAATGGDNTTGGDTSAGADAVNEDNAAQKTGTITPADTVEDSEVPTAQSQMTVSSVESNHGDQTQEVQHAAGNGGEPINGDIHVTESALAAQSSEPGGEETRKAKAGTDTHVDSPIVTHDGAAGGEVPASHLADKSGVGGTDEHIHQERDGDATSHVDSRHHATQKPTRGGGHMTTAGGSQEELAPVDAPTGKSSAMARIHGGHPPRLPHRGGAPDEAQHSQGPRSQRSASFSGSFAKESRQSQSSREPKSRRPRSSSARSLAQTRLVVQRSVRKLVEDHNARSRLSAPTKMDAATLDRARSGKPIPGSMVQVLQFLHALNKNNKARIQQFWNNNGATAASHGPAANNTTENPTAGINPHARAEETSSHDPDKLGSMSGGSVAIATDHAVESAGNRANANAGNRTPSGSTDSVDVGVGALNESSFMSEDVPDFDECFPTGNGATNPGLDTSVHASNEGDGVVDRTSADDPEAVRSKRRRRRRRRDGKNVGCVDTACQCVIS